ncbi:hypothetical protein FQR65_LT20270 [Abscondita terminalis]|nr:hypothetical protein FQR65_LT20270 [Abscondita terminalis]
MPTLGCVDARWPAALPRSRLAGARLQLNRLAAILMEKPRIAVLNTKPDQRLRQNDFAQCPAGTPRPKFAPRRAMVKENRWRLGLASVNRSGRRARLKSSRSAARSPEHGQPGAGICRRRSVVAKFWVPPVAMMIAAKVAMAAIQTTNQHQAGILSSSRFGNAFDFIGLGPRRQPSHHSRLVAGASRRLMTPSRAPAAEAGDGVRGTVRPCLLVGPGRGSPRLALRLVTVFLSRRRPAGSALVAAHCIGTATDAAVAWRPVLDKTLRPSRPSSCFTQVIEFLLGKWGEPSGLGQSARRFPARGWFFDSCGQGHGGNKQLRNNTSRNGTTAGRENDIVCNLPPWIDCAGQRARMLGAIQGRLDYRGEKTPGIGERAGPTRRKRSKRLALVAWGAHHADIKSLGAHGFKSWPDQSDARIVGQGHTACLHDSATARRNHFRRAVAGKFHPVTRPSQHLIAEARTTALQRPDSGELGALLWAPTSTSQPTGVWAAPMRKHNSPSGARPSGLDGDAGDRRQVPSARATSRISRRLAGQGAVQLAQMGLHRRRGGQGFSTRLPVPATGQTNPVNAGRRKRIARTFNGVVIRRRRPVGSRNSPPRHSRRTASPAIAPWHWPPAASLARVAPSHRSKAPCNSRYAWAARDHAKACRMTCKSRCCISACLQP